LCLMPTLALFQHYIVAQKYKTRSLDTNMSNNKRVIMMKVESKADIVFEG